MRSIVLAWTAASLAFLAAVPSFAASETLKPAESTYPAYQKLLDEYLRVVSKRQEPIVTRFDYVKLAADTGHASRLAAVRSEMLTTPPGQMEGRSRLAWAINTYNFLVLEHVTKGLHAERLAVNATLARGERLPGVREMRFPNGGFFEVPVVEIDGTSYTLNQFESHFVSHDFDHKKPPPPADLDPRAHFALVCAAIGCPPLMPRTYEASTLDMQLDDATRNALASPAHLKWNSATRRLEASSLFQWYGADFGGPAKAIDFIRRYAPAQVAKDFDSKKPERIDAFIPWDWNLNRTP